MFLGTVLYQSHRYSLSSYPGRLLEAGYEASRYNIVTCNGGLAWCLFPRWRWCIALSYDQWVYSQRTSIVMGCVAEDSVRTVSNCSVKLSHQMPFLIK